MFLQQVDSVDGCNIQRYQITVRVADSLIINPFGGSMIRGALGHALRHLYCSCTSSKQHTVDCLYANLFEADIGHTFVITPPKAQHLKAGGSFVFFATLLNATKERKNAFLSSLEVAFLKGLGVKKTPCFISDITVITPEISIVHTSVKITLESPWLIKYRSQPLRANELTLAHFLIAIARRLRKLQSLGYLHISLPTNEQLLSLAAQSRSTLKLYDVTGERRSNRQKVKHLLSGVRGSLTVNFLDSESLRSIVPMLHYAQWLHAGGKISFGQGALMVTPQDKPQSQLQDLYRLAIGEAI